MPTTFVEDVGTEIRKFHIIQRVVFYDFSGFTYRVKNLTICSLKVLLENILNDLNLKLRRVFDGLVRPLCEISETKSAILNLALIG